MGTSSSRALLGCRSWLRLTAATLVSRFGDAIDTIALAWLTWQVTGSALLMGGVLAVNALPNVVFAPLAGVVADRMRKRTIVALAHLGRGLVVSTSAVLYLTGLIEVWQLFVLTFLTSTFETFGTPAQSALTIKVVPQELLAKAGGFASSAATVVQMVGLGVAGTLIALVGIGGVMLIDGATFAVATLTVWTTRIEEDTPAEGVLTVRGWWGDFRAGIAFCFGVRPVVVMLVLAMFTNLTLAPLNVLEPVYVKKVLAGGPDVLSWLGLAILAGMALGGLAAGSLVGRLGTWTTMFAGFVFLGLAYASVGLVAMVELPVPPVLAALGSFFVTGLAISLINTPIGAWLSGTVPRNIQGRVFATLHALCLAAYPLGTALAGAAAALVPMGLLFLVLGLLVAGVTVPARLALGSGRSGSEERGIASLDEDRAS